MSIFSFNRQNSKFPRKVKYQFSSSKWKDCRAKSWFFRVEFQSIFLFFLSVWSQGRKRGFWLPHFLNSSCSSACAKVRVRKLWIFHPIWKSSFFSVKNEFLYEKIQLNIGVFSFSCFFPDFVSAKALVAYIQPMCGISVRLTGQRRPVRTS